MDWESIYEAHRLWIESEEEQGKQLVLRGSDLQGFVGEELDFTLADLEGCDLTDAELTNCKFVETSMKGVFSTGDTDLSGSEFEEADLREASLPGVRMQGVQISDSDLSGATLDSADMRRSWLSRSDFRGASMVEADFRKSDMRGVDMRAANLKEADFEGCDLREVDFREATLEGADFQKSDAGECDFESANIEDAKFEGILYRCDFTDSVGDPASFEGCDDCMLAGTMMHELYEPSRDLVEATMGIVVYSVEHAGEDYFLIVDNHTGEGMVFTAEDYEMAVADLHNHNDPTDSYEAFWDILSGQMVDDPLVRYTAATEHEMNMSNTGVLVETGAEVEEAEEIARENELSTLSVYAPGDNESPVRVPRGRLLVVGNTNEVDELSALIERVATKPVKSYSRKRKAVSELKKVTTPMKIAAFKRTFPHAFEVVKGKVASQTIDPATARKLIDEFGLTWHVSQTKWASGLQRLSPKPNEVMQFNVDITAITSDPEILDALNAIRSTSYQSEHPVVRAGPMMTVGWVRYADFPLSSTILIEEVQSDLPTVRKATDEQEEFREQLESKGGKEAVDRALKLMQPFVDRFYEDAVAAMFDLAEEIGRSRVEMLTYQSKKSMGSPMSVYEKLPKRMGMRKTKDVKSEVKAPAVWAMNVASPNPAGARRANGAVKAWTRGDGFTRIAYKRSRRR